MSDNSKDLKSEDQVQIPQSDIKLLITLGTDGKINVVGPIDNEPLAFWLLDKAKDMIKVHNIQKSQSMIAPAHGGIMNFIRGKK